MWCPPVHQPVAGAPFERCTGCGGGVIALRDLEYALEGLEPDLAAGDEHTPMQAVPDPGGVVACPMCSEPMSSGGYQEQNYVRIDRCVRCMVLFLDVGELEAMAEQRVRSERQRHDRYDTQMKVLKRIEWLVSGADAG